MRAWMFHKDHDPKIFDSDVDDFEELAALGWVDTPAKTQRDMPEENDEQGGNEIVRSVRRRGRPKRSES